jgi:L-aminopeptidase/D-esterase-like protein
VTADLLAGFRVGHWTHDSRDTGCTVVIPPLPNVTSCDIRGSAPSTREVEHLHPDRRLTEVHAIVLTGGSAFGLAAADGVVEWLEERGIGYASRVPVPIVPAAVINDLGAGDPKARPGPKEGRLACDAASDTGIETGRVGAAAGASVGKWAGLEHRVAGGLGIGRAEHEGAEVAAVAVVNAVGDVVGPDGTVIAGTQAKDQRFIRPGPPRAEIPSNTVLAVVAMRASLDKRDVRWLSSRGADGVTIAVRPAHTRYDGDVCFAVAAEPTEETPTTSIDVLGQLATIAVAEAVRDAVGG